MGGSLPASLRSFNLLGALQLYGVQEESLQLLRSEKYCNTPSNGVQGGKNYLAQADRLRLKGVILGGAPSLSYRPES